MKAILINLFFWLIVLPIASEDSTKVIIREIELNNTTLALMRSRMEVGKLANLTGISPADPQVMFNYLWGKPAVVGNKIELSVIQSFDFPTAYIYRNRIAKEQNNNLELTYQAEKLLILTEAAKSYAELSYVNKKLVEYLNRQQNAGQVLTIIQKLADLGEVNALELNKAGLNYEMRRAELEQVRSDKKLILSRLKALNGGKDVKHTGYTESVSMQPVDFEAWFSRAEMNNPVLRFAKGQVGIAQQQIKLRKAERLPGFSAGYMSENVGVETFQGIVLGVTLPLWEPKNAIKQAQKQLESYELESQDARIQFYSMFSGLYERYSDLQKRIVLFREAIENLDNNHLLLKALAAGEISVLSYIQELGYFYEIKDKLLESERDAGVYRAELQSFDIFNEEK